MKGYKCDKCGKFFNDIQVNPYEGFETKDENDNRTIHLPENLCHVCVDLCGDCTQELWVWLGKENLVPWGDIRAGHKKLKEMDPSWKPLK